MRRILHDQLHLVPTTIDHVHARELNQMSAVLDALPEAVAWVHADLLRRAGPRVDATKGRDGMTAEQVLRALVVKQMNGFSYEELSFHLADSNTYRAFCRLGIDQKPPKKSTLQKNIKCVRAETWEAINRKLITYAAAEKIEMGEKVRTDCTVVESNIHEPTDSSLLRDCVRVLTRQMSKAEEDFGLGFKDHSRRAKRRALAILNAKSNEARLPLYRDLLKVTKATVRSATRIAAELDKVKAPGIGELVRAGALAQSLRHYATLAERVIDQTERRVLRGESVPANEKIVSIFEPHTDIIVKDRRETLYGHKICLTTGASGLVTDVVIEEGNPADSTLAVDMVMRQREIFGRVPRQVSFDGGFASGRNLTTIKDMGVEDVVFTKRCGMSLAEMVKSTWVYRCLRNFRAGIEGTISFLKRVFGLDRCTWSGFGSFKAYVCGSVLACNLLVLARHLLNTAA
ncbi:MAG TPA: ISNCY family transposase [Nitrospiraceae bacterium]